MILPGSMPEYEAPAKAENFRGRFSVYPQTKEPGPDSIPGPVCCSIKEGLHLLPPAAADGNGQAADGSRSCF